MDWIIIVAGGHGLRMGGDVPKQFRLVGGKPVLMWTIDAFRHCGLKLGEILVLPHEQHDYWLQLCRRFGFSSPQMIADGGNTRSESVRNALALLPLKGDDVVVGIHDGVRPFVSEATIRNCYDTAHDTGAAIPVTPVVETLRLKAANHNVRRDDYCLVQTPQCFEMNLLKRAYENGMGQSFTDDASVVEATGKSVSMVEGNRENIKLTTPFDLLVAEAILKAE